MISEEQVRQIKESVDLVQLMGEYTSLKKSGSNFVGCCPFHAERTPSMQVYVDEQRYNCFGCKVHGDAISLIMDRESLEFHHAVEFLARRAGIEIRHENKPDAKPRSERTALLDAFEQAVRFYEHCLWETPGGAGARDYLRGRGLDDETLKRFRVGWAPGRGALLTKAVQLGIEQRLLRELDLLVDRDDHLRDRFFDRITFPICDRFGSPIAISARVLPEAERAAKEAGREIPKYVNTAGTPLYQKGSVVFNLHRARAAAKEKDRIIALEAQKTGTIATAKSRIIVMEAQTGAIAAAQCGIDEAVSCLGTALTADHVKQLGLVAGDGHLILMFDGDKGGRESSIRAVSTCLAAGIPVMVASLPEDKDPAELLVETEDAEKGRIEFDLAIRLAKKDLEFLLDALAPNPADLDNASRLDVADRVLAALKPMPDDGLRDLHLVTTAKYLKLDRSLLKRRAPWTSGTGKVASRSSRSSDTRGLGNRNHPPNDSAEHADDGAAPVHGLHDQGNAERFVNRHGKNLRYCFEYGKNGWFIWTGSHWKQDATQEVNRMVVETLTSVLPREADAYRERQMDRVADQVETWLRTSLNQRKIDAVLTVAQKETGIGVTSAQLNADPWLFACANGTIDLKTATLRTALREDLITRCSPATYDPTATSERWTKFLNDLTKSDPDMIAYLQRAAGYSMSGSTREEVMFLIHGPGGSGKSTFMSAIETVLGEYAATIDFEMFLASNVGKRETYYAAIQPARLVQCEESGDGKRFAEDVVKKVTGGNQLQARHLYGSAYSYVPRFKVWMVTNELPRVSDTDSGFWRRVQVIGCTNEIPAERRDKDFKDWLRHDQVASSALIAWCVAGAKAYFEHGLAPPETVAAENSAYRLANDPLQEFLDEYTFWGDGNMVTKADLTKSYQHWVEESNQGRGLTAKAFCKRMEARGAVRGKTRTDPSSPGPIGCWRGVRLRNDMDRGDPNAPSAAGINPKTGTSNRKMSGPVAVPVPVPVAPALAMVPVSDTSGTGIPVPGPEAGPQNSHLTTEPPTTGTAGPQNPTRTREGPSSLIHFSEQKKHTEICGPAVPETAPDIGPPPADPAPNPETRDPRGTRLARPPNDSEDVLDDSTDGKIRDFAEDPDDFDPPPF